MYKTIKSFLERNWQLIFVCFCLTLIFFGTNAFINYNTDTYIAQENVASAAKDMIFRNGRPIIGLVYYVFWFKLGLNVEQFATFSFVLAIIFLSSATFVGSKIILRIVKNRWAAVLLSFITICNLLIVEYFMFIEKGCFALAIFFAALAAYFLLRLFETKRKINVLWCLISILLVTLTYQAVLTLFIALSLLVCCLDVPKTRFVDFWKRIGLALTFFICGGLIAILYSKIFGSSRASVSFSLVSAIATYFISYGKLLLKFGNLLPTGVFLSLFIILLLINVFLAAKQELRWHELCYLVIIVLLIPACALSPLMLGTTDWLTARVVYGFGCVFGLFIINILRLAPNYLFVKRSLAVGCLMLLIFQYFTFSNIFIAKYQNDTGDKYTAEMIQEIIRQYESKNNKELEKIAFYYDQYPNYGRYGAFWRNQDFVVSSFDTNWSNIQSINYYNGTRYEKYAGDEMHKKYCEERNWDTFSAEQLVFDEGVLHLCVY